MTRCHVVCAGCERDCSAHYLICDGSDGAWCVACFRACDDCPHGGDCVTQILNDGGPQLEVRA